MIGQTRPVLEKYRVQGGNFREVAIADTGHCPFIEKSEEFMDEFGPFVEKNS